MGKTSCLVHSSTAFRCVYMIIFYSCMLVVLVVLVVLIIQIEGNIILYYTNQTTSFRKYVALFSGDLGMTGDIVQSHSQVTWE